MEMVVDLVKAMLSSELAMVLVVVGLVFLALDYLATWTKRSLSEDQKRRSIRIGIVLLALGVLSAALNYVQDKTGFIQKFDTNVFVLTLVAMALIAIILGTIEALITHRHTGRLSKENEALSAQNVALAKQIHSLTAHNSTFTRQIERLQNVSKAIADQTRKPLFGIEEIWCQISRLLEKVPTRGKFWFVGMTLGFGPVHEYRIEEKDGSTQGAYELLREKWPDVKAGSYENAILDFNGQLKGVVPSSGKNATVVCLNKNRDFFRKNFIEPFKFRRSHNLKEEDIEKVLSNTLDLHDAVEKVMTDKPIHYLDFIPLQMVVADIKGDEPGSPIRKACVVFYVGTGYVGAQQLDEGEVGFYSELEQMCDMFVNVAESLYSSGQATPQAN